MSAGASMVATATTPAWIVGSSGLLAGELARLLEGHPSLELRSAVSREGGRSLRELHPHLERDLTTIELDAALEQLRAELVHAPEGDDPALALFLGLPHGQSAAVWQRLTAELGDLAERVAVVDLSADYRLADPELHAAHYGAPAPDPSGREAFVYGLPELRRGRIRRARRVAAPGCFATALQLAVLPAAVDGWLDLGSPWILNAVTGSSGSGIAPKATTHHPFRHGSFKAYSPTGHRHEAELEQSLADFWIEAPLHFLPHSGPWSRGIHLTASLPLGEGRDFDGALERLRACYAERYDEEPFVRLLPAGEVPELRTVVGSNRVDLALFLRGRVLTVLAVIDNTIKGGSGQALQCMNLMLGLPEAAGLARTGLAY